MRKYRSYNEQNMGVEKEFLRRWNKHKNIVVGKDKDNLEWYNEAIEDLEPYLKELNIIKVAFNWKNITFFSFGYYLENPIKTRKDNRGYDIPIQNDKVANDEVEKFFDVYRPLVDLDYDIPCSEIWFQGTGRELTFHFEDKIKGFKTWLRAVKIKREKFLENNSLQTADAITQTDLTAEKISQMEAQIEILLNKDG